MVPSGATFLGTAAKALLLLLCACSGEVVSSETTKTAPTTVGVTIPTPERPKGVPEDSRWVPFVPETMFRRELQSLLPPEGGVWCRCTPEQEDQHWFTCEVRAPSGSLAFTGTYFANPMPETIPIDIRNQLSRVDGYVIVLQEGKLSPKRVNVGNKVSWIYDYAP